MDPSVAAKSWRESGDHESFDTKKASGRSLPSVPKGWPAQLDSPLVWTGRQLHAHDSFEYILKEADKEEINSALEFFLTLGLNGSEVKSSNFPLPTLGIQLRRLAVEVQQGRGFAVVRGLDRSRYSVEDNVIIYLGISSYIGQKRGMQYDEGLMFGHIRQANMAKPSKDNRQLRDSNRGFEFHTDRYCDILSMAAVNAPGRGGGNTLLASAGMIYNELAVTRPDILEVLARPNWAIDAHGGHYVNLRRPILSFHNGQLIVTLHLWPLLDMEGVTRIDGVPRATPEQMEAFEVLQALARKHQFSIPLNPGDYIFSNNFALLHSREIFRDTPESRRYMLRLWLKNEELAWKLPQVMEWGNRTVFYDDEVQEVWNVAPHPRINFFDLEWFTP